MFFERSIFWFRQDLRIEDNVGFFYCIEESRRVLPLFIIDMHIVDDFGGVEDKKFGLLREMLENLDTQLKTFFGSKKGLYVFYDFPENILPMLVGKYHIQAIYTNRTYGRYGKQRDTYIRSLLSGIVWKQYEDYLLVPPGTLPCKKVFFYFYSAWKKAIKLPSIGALQKREVIEVREYVQGENVIPHERHHYFTLLHKENRLKCFSFSEYSFKKHVMSEDGVSELSPYIRFGVISPRRVYTQAVASGSGEDFIRELAWRDFWYHLSECFPESMEEGFGCKQIHWENNEDWFRLWCQGKTGYPLVDACMIQLHEQNWMHGRCRMIVASFLTKVLHIHWKYGENFFKRHLLDYTDCVNVGNWQWVAGVGVDTRFYRIFSPMLQSKKYDPQGIFIKKYIPQLQGIPPKVLHNPLQYSIPGYYVPMVDYNLEKKKTRDFYV